MVVFRSWLKMSIATSSSGPLVGEQFQVALSLEESSVFSAFKAVADCRVDVTGHLCPVEPTFHAVVHAKLPGASCQFWILW